jgi:dipeptidyl aminopeptidase/acylaminoacyl peptidase
VLNVSDVQFSPDGKFLAFGVALPVKGTTSKSEIWVLRVADRDLRRFATSGKTDRMPRWAPDGRRLGFLSDRDGRMQLYVIPADGGEAERLTEGKAAVSWFAWSPDGKTVAYLAGEPKTEAEEKKEADKDDARVIGSETPPRLWILDAADKKSCRLAHVTRHVADAVWGPKSDALFVLTSDEPDATTVHSRISRVPVDGGEARELFVAQGFIADPQVSPDGTSLTFLAPRGDGPLPHDLFRLPVGGGTTRNLTADALDRPVAGYAWQPDGRILATVQEGFLTRCVLVNKDGTCEPVGGLGTNPAARVARDQSGLLAYVGRTATEMPEVWLKTPSGQAERVTSFNDAFRDRGLVKPEYYRFTSFDGTKVEAALYRPPGLATGTRAPLAVMIHGGPTGRWEDRFDAWTQLLVSRGYAVFAPNVRGSTGYGWNFSVMNRADWGGGDFKDAMAGVDDLIAKGIADPDRLGIGGWSYGGYMAAWAITQTTRFKGAVVGAGMSDLASEFGTETGPAYDAWFYGVPYEKPKGFVDSSPITHIKKARTPTLILHGENDPVDPIGQAQQLHRGLKHYGVTCEYVVYPREGHGLREEKHVLDSHRRVVDWFDKYVKGTASNPK